MSSKSSLCKSGHDLAASRLQRAYRGKLPPLLDTRTSLEIAAGSPKGRIALIQDPDAHAGPRRAVGDRRPDKATPYHGKLLIAHVTLPSTGLLLLEIGRICPIVSS